MTRSGDIQQGPEQTRDKRGQILARATVRSARNLIRFFKRNSSAETSAETWTDLDGGIRKSSIG